jgi:hypothetical protein
MKHLGPLVTLIAGGVLAAGVGGLSVRAASQDSAKASAQSKPSKPPANTSTGAAPAASAPAPGGAASQSAPAQNVKRDYAGYTRSGSATLAIAVRGNKAVAYLCDGRVAESWLRGNVSEGQYQLSGKNGAELTAWNKNGKIVGSARAHGVSYDFTVTSVKRPSGLYRLTAQVRGSRLDGGWIVLPNGRQVGLLTTNNGTPVPAPALNPATGSVNVNGENVPTQEVQP